MSNNIIDFNSMKSKLTKDRLIEIVNEEEENTRFIENFAHNVAVDIVDAMQEFGYNISDNPDCIKDLIAIMEATEALLQRSSGGTTSFQQISDHIFSGIFDTEDTKKVLDDFLESFND